MIVRFRTEQRLRRQTDIRAVREGGSRSDWRYFTCWCLKRDPLQRAADGAHGPPAPGNVAIPARVAVVASIAAIGNAVERNRAKRRLREVYRRHQDKVPPGADLLLIARTAIKRAPFADLEQRFLAACSHLQGRA